MSEPYFADPSVPVSQRGLVTIEAVRRFVQAKDGLRAELAQHVRVRSERLNEATYTAIVWDALQRHVSTKFLVEIDSRLVPTSTSERPDLIVGGRDQRIGFIAIEIKHGAHVNPLIDDLRKLESYIAMRGSRFNAGALIYFATGEAGEGLDNAYRRIQRRSETMARKLAIVHVPIPRNRADHWHR